ncbi:hypothetical protein [Brevundimonas aurantiaca]|jgi:hypothetical protein|uniref:hypothetical protein n=1 Tax=Brevundimonas aurantiaca TaxID=74316 RepID=UPI002FDED11E
MSLKFDFKTLEQPFEADWPVIVPVPQDGGGVQDQEMTVRFRTLTPEEIETVDKDKIDPGAAKLRLAIVDVRGETFSAELVEKLLARGYVYMALLKAHAKFVLGQPAKN